MCQPKTLNQQSERELREGGFTPAISKQKQLATFTLNETFICQEMLWLTRTNTALCSSGYELPPDENKTALKHLTGLYEEQSKTSKTVTHKCTKNTSRSRHLDVQTEDWRSWGPNHQPSDKQMSCCSFWAQSNSPSAGGFSLCTAWFNAHTATALRRFFKVCLWFV